MTVEAGAGDVVSRVVLQVRATVGDDWVSAATIWEAGFLGGDPDEPFGRILLDAAQTMISAGGDVVALFDEDGVHFANAFIANLTGDNIAFHSLVGDHLVVGSIDSPSLAKFQAVTEYTDINSFRQRNSSGSELSFTHSASVVVDNPAATPLIEFATLVVRTSSSGSGNVNGEIHLIRNDTGPPPFDADDAVLSCTRSGTGGQTTQTVTNYRNDGLTTWTYDVWDRMSGFSFRH